jgi:hypothetical protein
MAASTTLWAIGIIFLALGGAVYFGLAQVIEQPLHDIAGGAYGFLPAIFWALGCLFCSLAYIQKAQAF